MSERAAGLPHYVEKLRVPVRVVLLGEPAVAGFVSLAPRAEYHDGPETLLERLNDPTRIVPFQRAADGAVLLLTRLHVDWIEADADVARALLQPPTYRLTREEHVCVRLIGGAQIDGILPMELPQELNRASDFMNGAEDFFPLVAKRGTRLVNKLRVIDTRVFEASPKPLDLRAA